MATQSGYAPSGHIPDRCEISEIKQNQRKHGAELSWVNVERNAQSV